MSRQWIILGGGGHAAVVVDTLRRLGQEPLGYTDPADDSGFGIDLRRLGDDEVVDDYAPSDVYLANGLGSVSRTGRRAELYRRFAERGYRFGPIVHPSAIVAGSVRLADGAQVMAGGVLQANCRIGANALVNTSASIDHDCVIEDDVHIAPGATLSGDVIVERGAHVGVGATVIQGCRIGRNATVGAGAVVVHDVAHGDTVMGIPARSRDK
jgi:sugar O-acyltransferase (sialic acid O-acetyltransferase NeuD family)